MQFAGMKALVGVAVVDRARSADHQTKGWRLGLVPLCTHPHSWGKGKVRGLPLFHLNFLLAHHPEPAVPQASSPCWCWCCCGIGVLVGVDAVVGVWRGMPILGGVSAVVGDVASFGTANQISPTIHVLTSVTVSPGL